jgi:hypothetical protein
LYYFVDDTFIRECITDFKPKSRLYRILMHRCPRQSYPMYPTVGRELLLPL